MVAVVGVEAEAEVEAAEEVADADIEDHQEDWFDGGCWCPRLLGYPNPRLAGQA